MNTRKTQLHPNQYFHIYNRGINRQDIFFESKNYNYFLEKYIQFVAPFVHTYAYCLLKNHFHLLIQVKDEGELQKAIQKKKEKAYYCHISNAFANWFKSYSHSINKMYGRTGSLFEEPFRRIEVTNDAYFSTLVAYIHQNPERHGFVEDFRDYPYSSYESYLVDKPTRLRKKDVLDWFGSWEDYQTFHTVNNSQPTAISDILFD